METDGKLGRNEVGLRAEHETLCSTSQHSTKWRSDEKFAKKEVGGFEFTQKPLFQLSTQVVSFHNL